MEDDVSALGAQLAYSLLLSLFPFLIFLFSVLGFSSITSEDVLAELGNIMPYEAFILLRKTITEIFDTQNGQILSFSLVFTVFAASSGFNAIIKGLNKAYDVKETRKFLHLQLISLVFTILVVFIIIAAMLLLVFGHVVGEMFFRWLGIPQSFDFLWNFMRFAIVLTFMTVTFMSLYRYAPALPPHTPLTWRQILPGALFSSVVWMAASAGFAFYIKNFGNYSRVYGSLGAVIILMLWLFISSVVILVGGEINAALAEPCRK